MLGPNLESQRLTKFLNDIDKKREIFLLAFYISLGIIFIGFFLLCFREIEGFFAEHQVLFYILVFSPICLSILSFVVLILMGTFFLLYDEYTLMKSQSELMYIIILQIIQDFIVIIVIVGLAISSGELSWPKNKKTTSMSKRK